MKLRQVRLRSVLIVITEKTTHVDVFWFIFLLLHNSLSLCWASGRSSSSGGVLRCGEEFASFWELPSCAGGNSNEVLESVEEGVRSRGRGGITGSQRDVGLVANGILEFSKEYISGEIKDLSIEEGSILENL